MTIDQERRDFHDVCFAARHDSLSISKADTQRIVLFAKNEITRLAVENARLEMLIVRHAGHCTHQGPALKKELKRISTVMQKLAAQMNHMDEVGAYCHWAATF